MKHHRTALRLPEFIALMAVMVSTVALSTDIMLPALDVIGDELEVTRARDTQLVVTTLFFGFALGQIVVGPLSDHFGRRSIIHLGYAVFLFGCLLSITATSFNTMLVGRIMQGLGAAAPRIITLAIVRDGYVGREMARIMSFVMVVFILVPALAPALGQGVLLLANWRAMFMVLFCVAALGWMWFALRQPETLALENRRSLNLTSLIEGVRVFGSSQRTVAYTVAQGLVLGAFLGYLSLAQPIYQQTYSTGSAFVLWFGLAALAIGLASVLNGHLVMRLGMRVMTRHALLLVILAALCFLVPVLLSHGVPHFAWFMLWVMVTFGGVGILFGNLNALAMEPLGHMAGLGAAIVGSLSTFIALPLGWLIGAGYQGGVSSLVVGFAALSMCALLITEDAELRARLDAVSEPGAVSDTDKTAQTKKG